MHDLQLYTFKLCPYAHRVRLALAEKQLVAEHIEIEPISRHSRPTGAFRCWSTATSGYGNRRSFSNISMRLFLRIR